VLGRNSWQAILESLDELPITLKIRKGFPHLCGWGVSGVLIEMLMMLGSFFATARQENDNVKAAHSSVRIL
jgi:pantoate kinase